MREPEVITRVSKGKVLIAMQSSMYLNTLDAALSLSAWGLEFEFSTISSVKRSFHRQNLRPILNGLRGYDGKKSGTHSARGVDKSRSCFS